ncbi:PaaI family thioesterase [Aquabacterium sp.]|uniref:PaaI family thioesterase n=1 Tax=Aquabacterium sp. TaxID=1872578 RepID=UPI002CF1A318|nr:PaaI family thioesterase [Aquabacterium sp.]HSW04354.1 PaaI family thioesterase [Aquabacterium sp.]
MDAPQTHDALTAQGWKQRSLAGFAGLIGPLWTRQEEISWAYGVLATADHLNPAGLVHGGMLTTLADHALSAIAWEALGRRACVTVQLDTHFLSAGRAGQFLEARGRVVRATSSLVFMQGQVSADGVDLVSASAILKVLALPPAGL